MDQPRFLAAVPALAVSDERRAVAFPRDALGFVELTQEGRGLGIARRDHVELGAVHPNAGLSDKPWGRARTRHWTRTTT